MGSCDTDICVIGAGAGGLSVAAGAAQLGAATVLIEKGRMGGDCLNYGCVPSKSLIAAADTAVAVRNAPVFGIETGPPSIDGTKLRERVRAVVAALASQDSVERFEGLGVKVIRGHARFVAATEVEADGTRVRARRIVVATGSSPALPPIAGLRSVPYLTNETVFDLDVVPSHLVIIGGGPVGTELAQAWRRLGAQVTLIEAVRLLPNDDPELVDVVRAVLRREGVRLCEGSRVEGVSPASNGVAVSVVSADGPSTIEGSHLLVATGRRPNVDDLDLDAAGITYSSAGIAVDRRLRTSNRKVYAVGDVVGGFQFTHVANHHAGIVIKNALFRIPAAFDSRRIPRVTYTSPELAQVGMTEGQARSAGGRVRILRWPFGDNDRAHAEGKTEGFVKAVVTPAGRILGAGIVGPAAGELIHVWLLAMGTRRGLAALATMVAPYPTLGEINKRVAGSHYTPRLFSERTRRLVRFLARFG